MQKKSNRGGVRAGAGRKATGRQCPLNIKLSQEAADKISQFKSKSEVIDQLIRKYI